jgi:hypothetical protein
MVTDEAKLKTRSAGRVEMLFQSIAATRNVATTGSA